MQIFYQKNSSNPLFGHPTLLIGLRIDAGGTLEVSEGQAVGDGVKFVGTIGRTQLENGNQNHLFVGANNSLYWPSTDNKLKAFRAYFRLTNLMGADPDADFTITTNLDDAQGLDQITNDQSPMTNKVIYNGLLFIERNGRIYDAQGTLVRKPLNR